jgi:hypothetical protein
MKDFNYWPFVILGLSWYAIFYISYCYCFGAELFILASRIYEVTITRYAFLVKFFTSTNFCNTAWKLTTRTRVFVTFRSSCVSEGHIHPTEWAAPVLCGTLVWRDVIVVGSWQGNFWHGRKTCMPKESIWKLESNCKLSIQHRQILSDFDFDCLVCE